MIGYNKEDAVFLWPAGEYDAVLQDCVQEVSKAGNDMYKLIWKLYSNGGKEMTLLDYIVFPGAVWRLKRLAIAFGALDIFEAENFHPGAYKQRTISVEVVVKNNKQYGDQNQIKEYIEGSASESKPAPARKPEPEPVPEDPDCPF